MAGAGGTRATGGALVLCDADTGRAWARAPRAPDAAARDRFLEVLAQTSNARLAAQAVRMSVRSFYALRQRDGAFADAWQRALAEAADMMAGDLISTMRGAAGGEGDGEGVAPLARGTDPKVVLAVLKIQAELARAGAADRGREPGAGTVRHVPLGMVRGEILRRLDALDGKAEGR